MEQLPQQLNWIDWGILLILALHTVSGLRRGFVMGALDLLGMVFSLGAAILGYRQVAALVLEVAEVPRAVAILGAFLGLVLLAQIAYSIVVNTLFRMGRPLMILLGPLLVIDRGLGTIPGIVKGLVFATLLLLPFALYPLVPQVTAGIERSSLASQLVARAVGAAPGLESLMGRELNEGLSFLTPPQTEEGMRINFGILGKLMPDPTAEERMLEMVNREREMHGLRPLKMDEKLRQLARSHSMEMFQESYFGHNSPIRGTPFDRMRQSDIPFLIAGENLAYAPSVEMAHEGLMNSPGHRANILRSEFGHVGIGVIRSEFRGSMFSQEFTN